MNTPISPTMPRTRIPEREEIEETIPVTPAANGGLNLRSAIAQLRFELKSLVRQEIDLAKTELSEKTRLLKRNAVYLAAGGVVLFAAALVLLFGFSGLAATAFENMGLSPILSAALGQIVVAAIVGTVGYILLRKAIATFSTESLKPEKTLETLGHNHHTETSARPVEPAAMKPSSDELKSSVDQTYRRVSELFEEIKHRMSPRYLFGTALPCQLKFHPLRSALIGAGTGAAGFFLIRKRIRNWRNGDAHHRR